MDAEVTVKGLTMRGRVLASLSFDGPATARQLSDRFATVFDYEVDAYWGIAGSVIVEALEDFDGKAFPGHGTVACIDGVWGIR